MRLSLHLLLSSLGCATAGACPEGQVRAGDKACEAWELPAAASAAEGGHWRPEPGIPWEWQLHGRPEFDVVVDAWDVDLVLATEADKEHIRSEATLICYFSAGSRENWRADADEYPEHALGEPLEGWPDERWVDIMDPTVRDIIEKRLDFAADSGCHAVEPDNVDAYANASGLPLNATEQLHFNHFLAEAAHARGLSVGLKNDLGQVRALEPHFDWALNEECAAYAECGRLDPFLAANKAVFHVEYVNDWGRAAARAGEVCGHHPGFSTLIKHWDLDNRRLACP